MVSDRKNLAKQKFAAEKKFKNVKTDTYMTLKHIQKGKYYLYCRGYKKKANGRLEYGDWSKVQKVEIKKRCRVHQRKS